MTLPDVQVQIADAAAQRFAPPSTATWMVGGFAERGPVGSVLLINSIGQLTAFYGGREATDPYLYDALDVFFREGGTDAYVSRLAGPDAVASSGQLEDASDPTIDVSASSPGAWGDLIEVIVEEESGGVTVTIEYDGAVVEASPLLETVEEVVQWATDNSAYVVFTALEGGEIPIAQTVTLANGDDDRANVTSTEIEAALAAFTRDLGAGQVSLPGFVSSDAREALLAHAHATNRIAKLDSTDTATKATVTAEAIALRSIDGNRFGAMFWPWDTCPSTVSGGTERTVPPCARNAALHARRIAEGGTVGDPVAGAKLPARYVHGLSQEPLSDADREDLNDAGVNVSVLNRGEVLAFGNRTLTSAVSEANWAQLSQSTVIAAIGSRGTEIGFRHVHDKVDGHGINVSKFVGELNGMLLDEFYSKGDLYGAAPADAFRVTPEVDIDDATATLLATIEAQVSPGADRVEISIFKQPIAG